MYTCNSYFLGDLKKKGRNSYQDKSNIFTFIIYMKAKSIINSNKACPVVLRQAWHHDVSLDETQWTIFELDGKRAEEKIVSNYRFVLTLSTLVW